VGGVELALRVGGGHETDVGAGDDALLLVAEVDADRGRRDIGRAAACRRRADGEIAAGDVLRTVGQRLPHLDDEGNGVRRGRQVKLLSMRLGRQVKL